MSVPPSSARSRAEAAAFRSLTNGGLGLLLGPTNSTVPPRAAIPSRNQRLLELPLAGFQVDDVHAGAGAEDEFSILGCQRLVRWPKCMPASSMSAKEGIFAITILLFKTTGTAGPRSSRGRSRSALPRLGC